MQVLVTGGAGFVGSHLCGMLRSAGHSVRVLDNLDPQVHGTARSWPDYLPPDLDLHRGDVRDRQAVAAALDGCDAVIHLAAAVGVGQSMYEIEHYCSVNVMGTAILLEEVAARRDQIRKLIVASSMSIYGEGAYRSSNGATAYPGMRSVEQLLRREWEHADPNGGTLVPEPVTETKPLAPASIYATNKRDQEEMCLQVGRAYGIPTVAMRMFNVFGPHQALSNPYTGVVAIFSSRLLNGQPPTVFEDGRQRRDFIHVSDVARAYLMALENNGADGLALNLGSGRVIDVLSIGQVLAEKLGRKDIQPTVTGKYREGDIRHCFADIGLIRRTLGWSPQHSFESGVVDLLEWLASAQGEDRVDSALMDLAGKGLFR